MPLTDSQVRNAKPQDKLRRLADGGGLYLEVSPTGQKRFRMSYRYGGTRPTVTFGTYPAMKLPEARIQREKVKEALLHGDDPAKLLASPKSARPAAADDAPPDRWQTVAENYIAFRQKEGMHSLTEAKLIRQLKCSYPVFGEKRVSEVTAQDILELVRPIEDEGKTETAHEVRTRCSQVFEFAEAEGFSNANPARRVVKAMVKRRRGSFPGVTDPNAIGALMRAIRGYDLGEPQIRIGLLLSAYLFPRNDMLRGATWSEIDLDGAMWEIPKERMKGGDGDAHDQMVPLPSQALDLLREARSVCWGSRYVLPSARGEGKKLSDPVWNMALRRLGYCTRTQHCHHGFRVTASTSLNELGFNRDWIERQLAHVDEDTVRRGYNKAQYLEGRTEMMQRYADWLDDQERRV